MLFLKADKAMEKLKFEKISEQRADREVIE